MDLLKQKRLLRKEAAARRTRAHADQGSAAATAVACHAVALAQALTPGWVSGYLAMQDEMDVLPAILAMAANGWQGCLPVVVGKAQPLRFRAWTPGAKLTNGVFGTRHPSDGAADVRPDLLLVPLLAFDRAGYRLGWGGGFYDRTLAELRNSGTPVAAVGVGYSAQEVDAVPRDHYDARLDWVVTEDDIIKITH
ncbi:5-formyltetrahydrofolate cyclo-ligase [bacterium SCSIO 12827]|nr:5-formyltetrahydrofolate cyclo-ligase [bacterium SCSIO 12827]